MHAPPPRTDHCRCTECGLCDVWNNDSYALVTPADHPPHSLSRDRSQPRYDRTRARRTRVQAAATLAGLLAFTFLAGTASLGRIRPARAPQQPTAVTIRQDDTTTAYHAGWRAGVAALGDSARPTYPNVAAHGNDPDTAAWAHGWTDGQAHTLATNHTDITLHEHESAPHAPHIGNRAHGPQREASHTSR